MKKIEVQDLLALSIDRILLEKRVNAEYPIRRVRLLNRRIPKGTLSVTVSHLFTGQLPIRLVVAMVTSKALNDDYKLNPFHFKYVHLNEVSVWIGDRQVPSKPVRMNFTTDEYALPYLYLMEGCGIAASDKDNADHLDAGSLQLD